MLVLRKVHGVKLTYVRLLESTQRVNAALPTVGTVEDAGWRTLAWEFPEHFF